MLLIATSTVRFTAYVILGAVLKAEASKRSYINYVLVVLLLQDDFETLLFLVSIIGLSLGRFGDLKRLVVLSIGNRWLRRHRSRCKGRVPALMA